MKLILRNFQCPGDILMLTACVRDLKRWYPWTQIGVRTTCMELWDNNPYIDQTVRPVDAIMLAMDYPAVHKSNQRREYHFLHGFIEYINEKLSLDVKLTEFKGDLHLTEVERTAKFPGEPEEPFWVIVAGGKPPWKFKYMKKELWQALVDRLKDIPLVQSGGKESDHVHHDLKGKHIINFVGKTDLRECCRLVSRAVGVISHVTFQMHLAMALDKRAVTLAGGLEPWHWESYPQDRHCYIHSLGEHECCKDGACWKFEDCKHDQRCFEKLDLDFVAEKVKEFHHAHLSRV